MHSVMLRAHDTDTSVLITESSELTHSALQNSTFAKWFYRLSDLHREISSDAFNQSINQSIVDLYSAYTQSL